MIDYLTGFEHQAKIGLAQSDNGGLALDRFESNAGQLSYPLTGRNGRCLRVAEDGANATRIIYGNTPVSQKRLYSLYFRVSAAPSVTSTLLSTTNEAGNGRGGSFNINTSGQITAIAQTNGPTRTGPTVSDGLWHHLTWWTDTTGTSHTLKWQVDGVAQTDSVSTSPGAADNVVRVNFGSSTTTHTLTAEFDDLISDDDGSVSYPFTPQYAIKMLTPSGDGTHNAGTNIIEDQAGNDIGAVTAFDLVDDFPPDDPPTIYVRQNASGSGNYAEVAFDDTTEATILAVMGEGWCGAVAGSTVTGVTRAVDSSGNTLTDIYNGGHLGLANRSVAKAIPPPGGDSWTQAELNGVKIRIGFGPTVSAGAGPRWGTLALEYAYVPSGLAPVTRKLQNVVTPLRW